MVKIEIKDYSKPTWLYIGKPLKPDFYSGTILACLDCWRETIVQRGAKSVCGYKVNGKCRGKR